MTSTLLAARVLLAGHLARTSRTLRNRGEDGVSTLELVIIVLGLIAVAVAFGVITTPKEAAAPARLEMLYNDLRSLLSQG